MNVDTNKNAPPSAAMSGNEPNNTQDEAEFLARENADAKAAMTRMLEEMKDSLQSAADVRLWTRQHPWAAVGAAAAAGFVAATAIVPSKDEARDARRRFADGRGAYDRAAYGPSDYDRAAYESPRQPLPASRRSAMINSLLAPLIDMAKVAIQSSIASAMGAAMQTSAADVADNREGAEPRPSTEQRPQGEPSTCAACDEAAAL